MTTASTLVVRPPGLALGDLDQAARCQDRRLLDAVDDYLSVRRQSCQPRYIGRVRLARLPAAGAAELRRVLQSGCRQERMALARTLGFRHLGRFGGTWSVLGRLVMRQAFLANGVTKTSVILSPVGCRGRDGWVAIAPERRLVGWLSESDSVIGPELAPAGGAALVAIRRLDRYEIWHVPSDQPEEGNWWRAASRAANRWLDSLGDEWEATGQPYLDLGVANRLEQLAKAIEGEVARFL